MENSPSKAAATDQAVQLASAGKPATAAVQAVLQALIEEPDPPTTVREPRQALDTHQYLRLEFTVDDEHRPTRR